MVVTRRNKKLQERKYWLAAAVALATLSVGSTTLNAKADTVTGSASAPIVGSTAAGNPTSSAVVPLTQRASSAAVTSSGAAGTSSTAQPGESSGAATGSDGSSAASPAPTVASSASDAPQAPAEAASGTSLAEQSDATATSTAASNDTPTTATVTPTTAKAASAPVTPDYADSGLFNWSVDQTAATATITGVNQQVSGTLNLPPTYTDQGKTYQVTAIGDAAFASQTGLTNNLTGVVFNAGLKTIGNSAFAYLGNLTNLDFSAATDLTTIGRQAFVSTGVTQLTLPANVSTIGDQAFTYSKLTSVTLPAHLTTLGDWAFASNSQLQTVDTSQVTDLTAISDHAFENDPLTSVTIPASVQTIGINAFANNHSLTTVVFAANSQLTSIAEGAFVNDDALTSVTIPASVQTIGINAFANNHSLKTVTFAANSQLTSIATGAFIYDGALTAITFPDSLQTIGEQAFLANNGLTNVTFGSGLQTIGDQAFTYDNSLQSADFSRSTSLQTIGTGAFEYDNLTQAFVAPTALQTIGDFAFLGNQLSSVTLNTDNLKTIGQSAFAYNRLTGQLTVPTSVKTIGDQAFYGNQLTAATIGTDTSVGQDALSYNRLTSLTGPSTTQAIAQNQDATIFTDSEHIKLAELLQVALGDLATANLQISSTTNQATFVNGQFSVPAGTKQFTFNWSLPINGTTTAYSGQYTVVLDDPAIKVVDSHIFVGQDWTPADNFISAQKTDGTSVSLAELTVTQSPQVNTQVPGEYQVTYSYGSEKETITVTVDKQQAAAILEGTQNVTYTGLNAVLDAGKYSVALPDGNRYTLVADDLAYAPTTNVTGQPVTVTLSAAGMAHLNALAIASQYEFVAGTSQATFLVNRADLTLQVNNSSKYSGTNQPDNLTATVINPLPDGAPLIYTLTREPGDAVGSYQITAVTDDPNYNVTVVPGTLMILANQQSLTGQDYTMYVGDTEPTVSDFAGQATAADGQETPVTVDLGTVDWTKAGNYTVTLQATGDQTKQVTLHLLANQQSLTGQDYTTYVGEPTPVVTDFAATATDKTGQSEVVTVDLASADLTKAGNYTVTLQATGGTTKQVVLHVLANKRSLTGQGYTTYVGDPTPTVGDFYARATDKTGAEQAATVDLTTADLAQAGSYDVTLRTADGQTKTVTLTVLANQTSFSGQSYAMYVGDPTPTVTNFDAHATDKTGAIQTVTVDLAAADLTQAGSYQVTLQAADGQTKRVTLTVLKNQQALTGQDYTTTIGDPTPTLTDFQATATAKNGDELPVTLNLGTANLTQAGTYTVTLTTSDGQSKNVLLHVLAKPTEGDGNQGTGDGDQGGTTNPTTPVEPTDPTGPVTPGEPGTTAPSTPSEPTPVTPGGASDHMTTNHDRPTKKPSATTPATMTHPATSSHVTVVQHAGAAARPSLMHQTATAKPGATPKTMTTTTSTSQTPVTATSTTKLPQTNERPTNLWTALGLLLGGFGLALRRRMHKQD